MVNLQSSINALQQEYNSNYAKLEELEKEYKNLQKTVKKKDRIEAELRNDIELHKVMVRNRILKKCIQSLKKEQKQIQALSDKYQVSPKVENSTEKINDGVHCTKEELEKQYQILDCLVAQNRLDHALYNRGISKAIIVMLMTEISTVFTFVFAGISSLLFSALVSLPMRLSVSVTLGVLSSIVTAILCTVNNKKTHRIIQKLNTEIKQENLTNAEQDLDQMVNAITKGRLELQEQIRMLEIKEQCELENPIKEVEQKQVIEPLQGLDSQLPEMDFGFTKQYKLR